MAVEELAGLDDLEHGRDRGLVLGPDRLVQAHVLDELEVAGGDLEAGLARVISRFSTSERKKAQLR